jgi:hypothetical protein
MKGMKNFMRTVKEVIVNNIIWIITTLLAIGAFAATVKHQGDSIAECNKAIAMERDRGGELDKRGEITATKF